MRTKLILVLILFSQFSCDIFSTKNKKEAVEMKDQKTTVKLYDKNFIKTKFIDLPVKEQADYVNSLNKKDKFDFLKSFLPNLTVHTPPNLEMRFLSTGKILFMEINVSHCELGEWQITDQALKIQTVKKKIDLHGFDGNQRFTDFYFKKKDNYKRHWIKIIMIGDDGKESNRLIYNKSERDEVGLEKMCKTMGINK